MSICGKCVYRFLLGAFIVATGSLLWAQKEPTLAAYEGFEAFELYDQGLRLLYGIDGVEINRAFAMELLKKAASEGFGPAYNLLGTQLLEGNGWFSSPRKANRMFEKGAALRDQQSVFNLAYSYRSGRGVKKDLEKARDLFLDVVEPEQPYLISPESFGIQKATEASAYFNLGGLYLEEDSIEFDIDKAHSYLMKGDQKGDAFSAMILAIHFAEGEKVERDDEKAEYYLDRYDLLSQNSMRTSLGGAYFLGMDREMKTFLDEMKGEFADAMQERITQMQVGFGVSLLIEEDKFDPTRAARWLEMGVEGDSNLARLRLARLYYRGEGVEEDKARARELLEGARRDEYLGDYNLGVMLIKGEGGEKDEENGRRLITRSAEGDLFVARSYLEDGGEPEYYSYEEAFEICEEEAEKGNAFAEHSLGVRYLNGYSVDYNHKRAKELIKSSADKGYAAAQYTFGTEFSGLLEPFNYGFTKKWVEAAAEQKYLPALHYQARMIENGFVYQRSRSRAIEIYKWCASEGYPESQTRLGRIYWLGQGVNIDKDVGLDYYNKAAEQDEPIATLYLGMAYRDGDGVEEDNQRAFETLKKASKLGALVAYHELGRFFEEGELGEPDIEEAIYWYEKAADFGYTGSMKALAEIYIEGRGVEQSRILALSWYSRALQQNYYDEDLQYAVAKLLADPDWSEGDPKQAIAMFRALEIGGYIPAKYYLAKMNYEGIGLEQSDKKAIVKFRKMASFGPYNLIKELGDDYRAIMKTKPKFVSKILLPDALKDEIHELAAEAAYVLGVMTREGRSVPKDERIAQIWFRIAADAGNANAQYALGKTLWSDHSGENGTMRALELLSKAAESGLADAQFFLGELFFAGKAVTLEEDKAVEWLKNAAAQAHGEAIKLLNSLEIRWEKLDTNESEEGQEEFDFGGVILG